MTSIILYLLLSLNVFADECDSLIPKSCPDHPTRLEDGTTRSWNEIGIKGPRIIENVRREMVAYLKSVSIDEDQRRQMIDRIQNVHVKLNFEAGSKGEGLFDPEKLEINITRGSIRVPSEFALIQVLAHEMAHSIDPCFLMGKGVQGNKTFLPIIQYRGMNEGLPSAIERFPMSSIHKCLLSVDSLGVENTEQKLAEHMKYIGEGPGNTAYLAHPLCWLKRHSEGFCEFIASEIVARYLNSKQAPTKQNNIRAGITNIVAAFCHQTNFRREESPKISFHPSTEDRARRILFAHPIVRLKAGCVSASEFKYCGNQEVHSPPKNNTAPSTR